MLYDFVFFVIIFCMIKKIFIIAIACAIFLSGCSWYPFYAVCPEYEIVEVSSYASCSIYELQDVDGNKIPLPVEVEQAFDCPLVLSRSNDFRYLLYMIGQELMIYDFAEENINNIYSFDDGFEGLSCKWSPVDSKIACVVVDQQNYDSLTKVVVLSIKKGEFLSVNEYDETVWGEFWFEGEDLLKYYGHNVLEDPQEIYEIQL